MLGTRRSSSEFVVWQRWARAIFGVLIAAAVFCVAFSGSAFLSLLASGLALVLAVVLLLLFLAERRARKREEALERTGSLKRVGAGDEKPPARLRELSAYDLGTDHEAVGIGTDPDQPEEYVPRDIDARLREMLLAAQQIDGPVMVVLRGASKAGKSRTLFEAASSDQRLRDAFVIAPDGTDGLRQAMDPRLALDLAPGPLLVWLDDLERFMIGEPCGMRPELLDELAAWSRPVIILATAGGRAAESVTINAVLPFERLYGDPRVWTVSLSSELSDSEEHTVCRRYEPEVAATIVEHGIGEYLVAAPALARKLDGERHQPGDPLSPEGAAIVWAAIDWSRSGMQRPVPEGILHQLWVCYGRGWQPGEEAFTDALRWAERPIYRTIALLQREQDGFRAYDWITAYADRSHTRPLNDAAWRITCEAADQQEVLAVGSAALARHHYQHAVDAFRRGVTSEDLGTRALSEFNLGIALSGQGRAEDAKTAYRRAIDAGHPYWSPVAMLRFGNLLDAEGDSQAAREMYKRAIASGNVGVAPVAMINLGEIYHREGNLLAALETLQEAMSSGHAVFAAAAVVVTADVLVDRGMAAQARELLEGVCDEGPPDSAAMAALSLGKLLIRTGETANAATVLRRAIDSGHYEYGPWAAITLGEMLAAAGDLAGARDAFKKAISSGHAECAPRAEVDLGVLLFSENDVTGAEKLFRHASESVFPKIAARGMINLGELLSAQGDPEAVEAFTRASESGDPDIAPAAALELGNLLAASSDPQGARLAYERAIRSKHKQVGPEAESALRRLSLQPDQ
jgi:tetratricopeptide (TPR) repeat protein